MPGQDAAPGRLGALALTLAAALLLAGCGQSPVPGPDPPSDIGWKRLAGTDLVIYQASLVGCDMSCVVDATIRNEGTTTYRLHDDCANQWTSLEVRDASGRRLYPRDLLTRCAMCSSGAPFAPGESRTKEVSWDGRDFNTPGHPMVGAGTYHARAGVLLHADDGAQCGANQHFIGEYNLTLGKQ